MLNAGASHLVKVIISVSGLKMKQGALTGALVSLGSNIEEQLRARSDTEGTLRYGRRRTPFSTRRFFQHTHIRESFMVVSISILLGSFREGFDGQVEISTQLLVPDDPFLAMQASNVLSREFLRNLH
jgi:hypothetical protein